MKPYSQNKTRPSFEVAEIFRRYGEKYRSANRMTKKQHEVMYAISHCRTSYYGFHVDHCSECGHTKSEYNSCRNRHCPKCQGIARKKWVEKRLSNLLPVPYYHVVFTLPHFLHEMICFNRKLIYELLFSKSAETLLTFGKDPKWLGGELGFFGVLHTWGQSLWQHPHLHLIVAGGALSQDGQWISPKHGGKFLFPVKALSKVFRGKFIEGLKKVYYDKQLVIPQELSHLQMPQNFEKWIDHLVKRDWVVYCKSPFSDPGRVIKYIGRYTHRVAISNHRLIDIENDKICFHYKDYKKKSVAWETMRLDANEFIRRFLLHVLPHRFHKIRHYGFLANGRCKATVDHIRNLLDEKVETHVPDSQDTTVTPCPVCKTGFMVTRLVKDGFDRIIFLLSESMTASPTFDTS